jgi:hypothetical protein
MANKPNNPSLWSRAKSLAKQKFDVYPSAYANGWAAKWYKGKGGTWSKAEYGMEIPMMAEGGKPEWLMEAQLKAQGYSGNALQQKMASMAQGGEPQNAGFQALPEYVQNKIMNAAFGGYIPDMGYGGMSYPFMQDGGEPDGEMALGQIAAVVDKMNKLRQFIQPGSDLEPWISSKLSVMDHYADAVSDYMTYNPEAQGEQMEMMESGGYTVTRSDDRKGKTHKVTGPDGTVKYFGDSKLGQHPNDPERKAAFYARHKKNLDGNPYFRAFARATWQDGGQINEMANGGYIGMDGKRHMSNTPTWSGNMGYQDGGEPIFPLAIPGSSWHANWEPSGDEYETADPMMEQFNQDVAATPAPKVAMNVPASSAAAPVDYKGVSIVDMLGSMGKASDYNSRKQLAAQLGIDNYYGSADQNLKMIKKIESNPSVLNDYTAAPVRKASSSNKSASSPSSSKKKSSPQIPALPVTQPTASMFSPNMYANAKAAYLAAHPEMTSEQYDAMGNSGKRTEVRENSKSLSEKAVAGKYDDKYFMRNVTPLNTDYRTQEAFNDAVLNMFTDQIPSAVLAAAGPGIVNSAMKRLITTKMYPYGLRMIPEVVSRSRHASRALPYATRALPYQDGGPVEGEVMDVTPEQLEMLKAQGYQFEII